MPKFKRPKRGCGLNLRGVIEGELLLKVGNIPSLGGYGMITAVVDAIEKRIKDGPSDWLSLSDGTTFDKSWVPEEIEPKTYTEKQAQIRAQIDAQERDTRPGSPRISFSPSTESAEPVFVDSDGVEDETRGSVEFDDGEPGPAFVEDKLYLTGHDSLLEVRKSLSNIQAGHEARVATNLRAASLEKDILDFESWKGGK